MDILITGAAGFIGAALSRVLIDSGHKVTGLDNLNDYYDVNLKLDRLSLLQKNDSFKFNKIDISDRVAMQNLFSENRFDVVVNLAAQAGVRYSIENPDAYIESNLTGFANILEGCRYSKTSHLVYASSSSVYGANKKVPFSTDDNVDNPVSLYAATKKSNELLAYAYSHLYGIPVTGLRFFTVYGPWGRPDMAYFKFTKAILEGKPIDVYNNGDMKRDFTYIDDIVYGVVKLISLPPTDMTPPYALYNIGNNNPEDLVCFINVIEKLLGRRAVKNMMPMQSGDVPITFADIEPLVMKTGFRPSTTIEEGLKRFIEWYRFYYNI